jgi:phage shock protein PspC (stress-responsive transcriptional regulator)
MKKTINIHLGRQLFIIEEDAYARLNAYLEKLKSSFASEEGAEEIVEDIEMRCAELIQNLLNEQKISVVQLQHVAEVIQSLGEPEEISENATTEEPKTSAREEEYRDNPKRLFRDMDNATIGGVCAGVAAYLNLDVAIIRILFAVSFFMGFGFPLYIILWVAVPNAKTPSDRLQLKGKAVTIDSIKDEISRTATAKKNEFMQSAEKWKNNHITDRLRNILLLLAKAFGIGIIIFSSLWLVGFTLMTTGILQIFPVSGDQNYASFYESLSLVCPTGDYALTLMWWSIVITGFTMPLFGLLLGTRILFNKKTKAMNYGLIGLPIVIGIGFTLIIVSSIHTMRDYEVYQEIENSHHSIDADEVNVKQFVEYSGNKKVTNGGGINFMHISNGRIYEDGVDIKTVASSDTLFHVYQRFSAHGIDKTKAIKRSLKIKHELSITGNTIYLDPEYSYPLSDGMRNQSVEIIIEVPLGKKLKMNNQELKDLNEEHTGIYYGNDKYDFWD